MEISLFEKLKKEKEFAQIKQDSELTQYKSKEIWMMYVK